MRTRQSRYLAIVGWLVVKPALVMEAQVPGVMKGGKLPTTSTAAPANASVRLYCGSITPEMVDRFLKALAAEKAALAHEQAKAKTKQQIADAGLTQVAQQQLEVMTKLSDCTDGAAAKDPRSKELDRLTNLSEAATAKGDDKLSEKYSDEASQLSGRITTAALDACKAEKAALDNLGRSGGTALDASEAAKKAMRDAEDTAGNSGAQAGNFTKDDYAMLRECTIGRLHRPAVTPTSPAAAAAIDARRDELTKALGIR